MEDEIVMPNMSEVSRGLLVLAKYVDDKEWLSAGHDVIYAPIIKDMSDKDVKKMEKLTWLRDGDYEDEDDFCWFAFT